LTVDSQYLKGDKIDDDKIAAAVCSLDDPDSCEMCSG
jgi:hypothetical protein